MSTRFRRFGWAAIGTAVLALTPPSLPVGASASTPESDTARPTINVSDRTVTLGKRATVYGRAPGLTRTVVLQMKTAENGWQKFAERVTSSTGGTRSGPRAGTAPIGCG